MDIAVRWARSASKHRFEQPPPAEAPAGAEPRLVYLGDDAEGVALEVMAVELEDGSLLVIRAMRLRAKYREQYEEAKRWQR